MKYVIVFDRDSEHPECRSFAATEEEAARKLEELLASSNGDGPRLKLYALEEVPFQVEQVPSVTVGQEQQKSMLQDSGVFEGFGPNSPYEHLAEGSEMSGSDIETDVSSDMPPATTIDGEPVGDAEVFTFEA